MTVPRTAHVVASNLHGGGGVQVAASIVDEFAELVRNGHSALKGLTLSGEISRAVARNCNPTSADVLGFDVLDRRPLQPLQRLRDARRRYDSVFVVFGPIYAHFRAQRRVMGYADVTSILSSPTGSPSLRSRVRGAVSRMEARRQSALIAESPSFKQAVVQRLGIPEGRVHVVPNAVNPRVTETTYDETMTARIRAQRDPASSLWAYPTRAYPHKNLAFLPRIRSQLATRGVSIQFCVTLREQEWDAQPKEFRDACINVGELEVPEVGAMMRACDAVFFPSLLEAFSATPIEALANARPLIASDRDFVRSVCGENAIYIDPVDPALAAEQITQICANRNQVSQLVSGGMNLVGGLPSSRDRALAILEILTDG